MKKKLAALAYAVGAPVLSVLAEGETSELATTMNDWVNTAKTEMEDFGTNLSPLFTIGIGILLLLVAWKLFKRVTKTAS